MNRNKKRWLAIALITATVLITGGVLGFAPLFEVRTQSSATRSFTIDQSMARVRKIFTRTNAAKKIIAGANAKLLDQEWLNMDFEIQQPIFSQDWSLNGDGQLTVETNDSYLGQHKMVLDQTLSISPERLHVTNQLASNGPAGQVNASNPVVAYDSMMGLTPDEQGQAKFETSLDLEIVTTAGLFTKSIVADEIRQAAGRSLKKQEAAIRDAVSEHDGQLIVIPDAIRGLFGGGKSGKD
jgi:hypothetical protein